MLSQIVTIHHPSQQVKLYLQVVMLEQALHMLRQPTPLPRLKGYYMLILLTILNLLLQLEQLGQFME